MNLSQKTELHCAFWNGQGPSLIFIPANDTPLYDMTRYRHRFFDPAAMLDNELAKAQSVIDHPTDGIPCLRTNLGVVVVPGMAGQSYHIQDDSMPWPGAHLAPDAIAALRHVDLSSSEIYQLADRFYRQWYKSPSPGIASYTADNQGVFDIAHLLYGDEIFYGMLDPDGLKEIEEVMEISLDLFIRASQALKAMSREQPTTMIHGHGTPQGLYFPHAGIRVSEDTATLLSPDLIESLILPFLQRSIEPFGGAFLHYCGSHPTLFDQFTALPQVKAIDLGNPEMYDLTTLLRRCAATDTVLYSRVAALPGEEWREYIHRIARTVNDTGARMVLRPLVVPSTREECEEMQAMWHDLTRVS